MPKSVLEENLRFGLKDKEDKRSKKLEKSLNLMKVASLVQLPEAMTGMILAGASPLEAVKLQIIVVYMLICAVSIAAVIAIKLSQKTYFTKYHQLIVL